MATGNDQPFVWSRPKEAAAVQVVPYPWLGAREEPCVVLDKDANWIPYHPTETTTALYHELAACEPNAEGVMDFVRRYGPLGHWSKDFFRPESLLSWLTEIFQMKELLHVWEARVKEDVKELKKLFRWEEGQVVNYRPSEDRHELFGYLREWWVDVEPEKIQLLYKGQDLLAKIPGRDRVPKGDVLIPASLFVAEVVNGRLPHTGGYRLIYDTKRKRWEHRYSHHNLLGVIYNRLALAVCGQANPRQCEVCKRFFEVSPRKASAQSFRADRMYCSNACRFKAYRQRQEEACRLHVEGKTFKEIAQELESDVKTVKGWILKHKG